MIPAVLGLTCLAMVIDADATDKGCAFYQEVASLCTDDETGATFPNNKMALKELALEFSRGRPISAEAIKAAVGRRQVRRCASLFCLSLSVSLSLCVAVSLSPSLPLSVSLCVFYSLHLCAHISVKRQVRTGEELMAEGSMTKGEACKYCINRTLSGITRCCGAI